MNSIDIPKSCTASETGDGGVLVLLVDGSREAQGLLADAFRQTGFHPVTASNAFDAIAKAVELQPDLVLSNAALPIVSVLDLARRFRRDPRLAEIPIAVYASGALVGAFDHAAMGAGDTRLRPCRDERMSTALAQAWAEGARVRRERVMALPRVEEESLG